jgi:hypothetical protein
MGKWNAVIVKYRFGFHKNRRDLTTPHFHKKKYKRKSISLSPQQQS